DEVELGKVDVDHREAGGGERLDRLAHPVADAGCEVGIVELPAERADPRACGGRQLEGMRRHRAEEARRLVDGRGQRAYVVERVGQRKDAVDRDEPVRRLQPDDPAVGGRDPDRAAGVGAERVVAGASAAEPELEPPDVRLGLRGLYVIPNAGLTLPAAYSSRFVLQSRSAAAARRLRTTDASRPAGGGVPTAEALVVTTPATSMLSLTATATPCSSPPAARSPGGSSVITAFRAGARSCRRW